MSRTLARLCAAALAAGIAGPAAAQGSAAAAAARERERREALKHAPVTATSFLGAWNGVEDEGRPAKRYPTVTIYKDGGTIAYEVLGGVEALRLMGLTYDGANVRFSIAAHGGARFYAGILSGDSITGTITRDADGRSRLGTSSLTRGAPAVLAPPEEGAGSRLNLVSGGNQPASKSSTSGTTGAASTGRSSSSSSSGPTSDTEAKRQAGEARLSSALASLGSQAARLLSLIRGGSCGAACDEVGRLLYSIGSGLERAEEEARQAGVLPGRVRDLRAQYRLDSRAWDELSAAVAQFERERKKKR